MVKIGLTGNFFSGHVDVAEIFRTILSVPVFDADIALKFALNYREDIIRNIRIQFGDVFNKGTIESNKFLGTDKFNRLVDVAFPEVMKMFNKYTLKQNTNRYVIFKSSILFERNIEKNFDNIISVFKPKDDRALDISKKSNISLIRSYEIIDSEMNELTKNHGSKFIIHNYDKLSLLAQSKKIHDEIYKSLIQGKKIEDVKLLNANRFSSFDNNHISKSFM